MSMDNATPAFGGRRKQHGFYTAIDSILSVLRPHSTLRTMAGHLNEQGFTTASGLPWTRERVASYLKSTYNKPNPTH